MLLKLSFDFLPLSLYQFLLQSQECPTSQFSPGEISIEDMLPSTSRQVRPKILLYGGVLNLSFRVFILKARLVPRLQYM